MLVIGENINASNKSVGQAIASRDKKFLQGLAIDQVSAGADFIDVNAGTGQGSQENEAMEWLVSAIQEITDKPLAVDSDNPTVIEAALRQYRGDKLIVNSVNAEPERLGAIGRLVAEHDAWVIALAMGTSGIPDNADERLAACDLIMDHLTGLGLQPSQILFDPLVLPISVDCDQGMVTLRTIERIRTRHPGAKTALGLSNISYGLPGRKLINRGFLLMAAYAGLDAVILDPLDAKIMSFVKVADMLTGKDSMCRSYIRSHRRGILVE